MLDSLRIVMLGTGDFALPTFEGLIKTGHHVVALITQPDRPQGRKQELIPSRIKVEAQRLEVRVEQPEDVNAPQGVELIRSLRPDLLITAAYGQILSAEVLGVPAKGGINLHGSILPAYRGAAPVARAIQQGEVETGVTVILMTPRVDAGGIIAVARTPIDPDETAGELEERLARLGAPLVTQAIDSLVAGTAEIIPQDRAQVTRAPKLRKEDGRIPWNRSARTVHNLVRAMQPWPMARTVWWPAGGGKGPVSLIVHKTEVVDEGTDLVNASMPPASYPATGSVLEVEGGRLTVATAGGGRVGLVLVQIPGKKVMPVADFLRGHRVQSGDRLGENPGA